MDKQFIATRAVIIKDNKVLIIREAQTYEGGVNPGKYDLPGGKVEKGETIEESLIRETKEESGLDIKVGKPFFATEWNPVVNGERLQIKGIFFICEAITSEVILSKDHDDYKWIDLKEYFKYSLTDTVEEALKTFVLN